MDWLSQYDKATEEQEKAAGIVAARRETRRTLLMAMERDGMTIHKIAELVHLKPATVSRMINKAKQETAELFGVVDG